MGMRLFFPLSDGIGMSLTQGEEVEERMGQYKGASTAFNMIASIAVLFGFKTGVFSLTSPVKVTFVIAAAASLVNRMVAKRTVIKKETGLAVWKVKPDLHKQA